MKHIMILKIPSLCEDRPLREYQSIAIQSNQDFDTKFIRIRLIKDGIC